MRGELMTRDECAAALGGEWELVNYQHDKDKDAPRCSAWHPRYGVVSSIYAQGLVDAVCEVTQAEVWLGEHDCELRRADTGRERPHAAWYAVPAEAEQGSAALTYSALAMASELGPLMALMRARAAKGVL